MTIRTMLKALVFGLCAVVSLPLAGVCWIEKRTTTSEVIFTGSGQLFSLIPGPIGVYLRASFYCMTLKSCSWQVHIGFGSVFSHRSATLGAHVSTGNYCVMGHVILGQGVIMGSRVSIPSGKRQHLDDAGNLCAAIHNFDSVSVGTGSWVGEGAIIIANVGVGCIVSAGAVVTKDVADHCLVGGNPARVLRAMRSAVAGSQ